MNRVSAAPAEPPLGSRQIKVLGWVVDRDVTRGADYAYHRLGRTPDGDDEADVDDEVYALEDRQLVVLLPDGWVEATPAGEQLWQRRRPRRPTRPGRPRRPTRPGGVTAQFTPAGDSTGA